MSAPFDGVRRAAGDVLTTLADLGHTRLQLAAVELEEERLRLVRLALLAAIAFFLLGLGLVVAAVFAVLLVDPPYRVPLLGAIAAASLVGAAIAWRQWRVEARRKPPLLQATLAEFERDLHAFVPPRP